MAFDVLTDVAGPWAYPLRLAALALVAPAITWIWLRGTAFLLREDPTLAGKSLGWADYYDATRRGLLPRGAFLTAVLRYLSPTFHPAAPASVARALEVLGTSPGVLAGKPRAV